MTEGVDGSADEIARCDEVIADNWESVDPVARRRVATAFADKARALSQRGHHTQAAEVWQQAIEVFEHDPPSSMPCFVPAAQLARGLALIQSGDGWAAIKMLDGVDRHGDAKHARRLERIQAEALGLKSRMLDQLGRPVDAREVDASIVGRFGDCADGRVGVIVAYALLRLVSCRLDEGRVSQALALSDQLVHRCEVEMSRDGQLALGRVLVSHLEDLLRYRQRRAVGLAIDALSAAARASVAAIGPIAQRLGATSRVLVPAGPARRLLETGVSGLVPGPVHDRRRLARRALRVAARVQQLDETGDAELEHLAATAKVYEAAALAALGRWRAANRIFDELAASGRSSTAQALSGLARRSEQTDSTLAEVGGVSMLFLRARALGQGDKRITRIALEESLRDGIGASRRSLLGKVVTRFYLGGRGRDSEP